MNMLNVRVVSDVYDCNPVFGAGNASCSQPVQGKLMR